MQKDYVIITARTCVCDKTKGCYRDKQTDGERRENVVEDSKKMDVEFVQHQFEDAHDGVVLRNRFRPGVRHVQLLYLWVVGVAFGIVRGGQAMAVLAMTDRDRTNDNYIQIHPWSIRSQRLLLASFLAGHALLLPTTALLRRLLGRGKHALTAALLASGGLQAAMPTIVNRGGWLVASNAQLWLGMTQGCVAQCTQAQLDAWLPPDERKSLSWLVNSGTLVGSMLALPISGLLSEAKLGWELVLYSQAASALTMAAVWGLLAAGAPATHHAVGDKEKEFIRDAQAKYRKRSLPVPWIAILRSRSFWGLSCAHAASNAVFVFSLLELPCLLRAFGASLRDVGWQSSLPLLSLWLTRVCTAPTVDWLCKVLRLSYSIDVVFLRKLINLMGACGVVAGLTLLPILVASWPSLATAMLVAVMGTVGFQFSGFLDHHRDLSENFSGSLLTMTSVVASAVGAAVPLCAGLILTDEPSSVASRYRLALLCLAGLYVAGTAAYCALADGHRPRWDLPTAAPTHGYNNAFMDVNRIELEDLTSSKQPPS